MKRRDRPRGMSEVEWARQLIQAEAGGMALLLDKSRRFTVTIAKHDVPRIAEQLAGMAAKERRSRLLHAQREIDRLLPRYLRGRLKPEETQQICDDVAVIFINDWRLGREALEFMPSPAQPEEPTDA